MRLGTWSLKKKLKFRDEVLNLSGAADLNITLQKGLEGLRVFKDEWDRIYSNMEHPVYYLDWRWMVSLQSFLIGQPLYFVVLQRRGKVTMIMPLHPRSFNRVGIKHNYLSFPHHKHVVLSDALIDSKRVEQEDFKKILNFLETQRELKWDYIKLSGLYELSPLRELFIQADLHMAEVSSNAYFDWKNGPYDASLSKKLIKNIRRLSSRAEKEQGPIQVRFVNDIESLPGALDVFLELEASGWKGESGTSTAIKSDPQLMIFYRELLDRFSRDGSFQINLLEINGIPAAGQMCIRCCRVWFILKIGYNDGLKQYGVGNILMLAFLEHASADPACSELNLVTSPAWADRWHLKKRQVYSGAYYNSNIRGRLVQLAKHSNKKLKGILKRNTD